MTISKDHKTKHSRPTVKQWYSLNELARDWTVEFESEFTEEYLIELASQPSHILTLGVIAEDWFLYRYDQGKHKDIPHFELLNGFTNLSVHSIKALISAESTVVDYISDCNGGTRCNVCTLGSQKSNVPCGRKYQDLIISDGPIMFLPLIHRADLKVSHDELIRYENSIRAKFDSVCEKTVHSKSHGLEINTGTSKFTVAESELRLEPLAPSSDDYLSKSELDLRIWDSEPAQFEPTVSQVNTNGNPIPHEAPAQYIHEQPVNSESDSISSELTREKAEQNLRREDKWKLRAREIADEIDPEHKYKIYVLAREIHERLKKEPRIKNRNNITPSANSIEREILRGRKSKK